jgi:hypothetical protein
MAEARENFIKLQDLILFIEKAINGNTLEGTCFMSLLYQPFEELFFSYSQYIEEKILPLVQTLNILELTKHSAKAGSFTRSF